MYNRILNLIKSRNLSIYEFEKQIGFKYNTFKSWKTSTPSFDKVVKVADFFNISIDELIGREHYNKSNLEQNEGQAVIHSQQAQILENANEIGISTTLELLEAFKKLSDIQKGRILEKIDCINTPSNSDMEVAEDFSVGEKTSS